MGNINPVKNQAGNNVAKSCNGKEIKRFNWSQEIKLFDLNNDQIMDSNEEELVRKTRDINNDGTVSPEEAQNYNEFMGILHLDKYDPAKRTEKDLVNIKDAIKGYSQIPKEFRNLATEPLYKNNLKINYSNSEKDKGSNFFTSSKKEITLSDSINNKSFVVQHEFFHFIDFISGDNEQYYTEQSPELIEAQKKDLEKINSCDKEKLQYLINATKGSDAMTALKGSYDAGRKELFADTGVYMCSGDLRFDGLLLTALNNQYKVAKADIEGLLENEKRYQASELVCKK